MENKSYKGLVWLIVILIILVVALMSFIIYKEFYIDNKVQENETSTTTQNIDNNDINLKIDANKDWVYDANYEADVKQNKYSTDFGAYNITDYKAPFININSDYANTANNEIKKLYDSALDVFNEGIEDGMSYIDTFEYKYYINSNILSLIITTGYGATDVVIPNYHSYNINIETGKMVEVEDLLNYINIDEDDFVSLAVDAIKKEFDDVYGVSNKNDETYLSYQTQTINDFQDNELTTYYIDNNKYFKFEAVISYPAGLEYTNRIITLK